MVGSYPRSHLAQIFGARDSKRYVMIKKIHLAVIICVARYYCYNEVLSLIFCKAVLEAAEQGKEG